MFSLSNNSNHPTGSIESVKNLMSSTGQVSGARFSKVSMESVHIKTGYWGRKIGALSSELLSNVNCFWNWLTNVNQESSSGISRKKFIAHNKIVKRSVGHDKDSDVSSMHVLSGISNGRAPKSAKTVELLGYADNRQNSSNSLRVTLGGQSKILDMPIGFDFPSFAFMHRDKVPNGVMFVKLMYTVDTVEVDLAIYNLAKAMDAGSFNDGSSFIASESSLIELERSAANPKIQDDIVFSKANVSSLPELNFCLLSTRVFIYDIAQYMASYKSESHTVQMQIVLNIKLRETFDQENFVIAASGVVLSSHLDIYSNYRFMFEGVQEGHNTCEITDFDAKFVCGGSRMGLIAANACRNVNGVNFINVAFHTKRLEKDDLWISSGHRTISMRQQDDDANYRVGLFRLKTAVTASEAVVVVCDRAQGVRMFYTSFPQYEIYVKGYIDEFDHQHKIEGLNFKRCVLLDTKKFNRLLLVTESRNMSIPDFAIHAVDGHLDKHILLNVNLTMNLGYVQKIEDEVVSDSVWEMPTHIPEGDGIANANGFVTDAVVSKGTSANAEVPMMVDFTPVNGAIDHVDVGNNTKHFDSVRSDHLNIIGIIMGMSLSVVALCIGFILSKKRIVACCARRNNVCLGITSVSHEDLGIEMTDTNASPSPRSSINIQANPMDDLDYGNSSFIEARPRPRSLLNIQTNPMDSFEYENSSFIEDPYSDGRTF